MLIGLLAKTAILLTEYASERRRQGMSISQAAVSAAQVRLRPILMTSLTMIFGMLPLMFASGVGANGNISIGVGTVGGMLIGTVALLLLYRYFLLYSNICRNVSCLSVNCRSWKKRLIIRIYLYNEENNYMYMLVGGTGGMLGLSDL